MTHPATLLRNSWRAYVRDFRRWLLLTLPLAAVAALFIVLDWLSSLEQGPLAALSKETAYSTWSIVIMAAVTLIVVAVVIFVTRCFSTAAIYASYNALGNQKPDIKGSYKVGYKMFWPVLWVAVLRVLIVAGGLLLLIVPGIIWGLQYSLATQVAVIEGKRGRDALRRSKELTKGRMFETLVNLGVIGLIIGYGTWLVAAAVLIVLIVLSGIVSLAIPASTYAGASITVAIIALLAETAVIWLAIPLSPLAITAMYKDFSGK